MDLAYADGTVVHPLRREFSQEDLQRIYLASIVMTGKMPINLPDGGLLDRDDVDVNSWYNFGPS